MYIDLNQKVNSWILPIKIECFMSLHIIFCRDIRFILIRHFVPVNKSWLFYILCVFYDVYMPTALRNRRTINSNVQIRYFCYFKTRVFFFIKTRYFLTKDSCLLRLFKLARNDSLIYEPQISLNHDIHSHSRIV